MTETTPHTSECAEIGALAEAHKKFEPFVGTFRAEVKMWMMGPDEPMVMAGTMTNTLELGGRYLYQDYKGDRADGPFPHFEGRGFWGYNTVLHTYEGFWIDSASTFMMTESGEVDASGKVWTMVGVITNPETGLPMQKKSIITLKDRDHHTMESYLEGPDGKEVKTMEITYRRQR